VRIDIDASKRIIVGRKKDAVKSGIGTRIIGIAHSLSIDGSITSSCPLLEIALNAMVMIGMTDPTDAITVTIGDLMGRLGGERPFMIGWGADSVCMIGLVIVLNIFLGIRKSLGRWLMHEFPMSSYFAGTPIHIGWSQGNIIVHRQGSHPFPHGVQRG